MTDTAIDVSASSQSVRAFWSRRWVRWALTGLLFTVFMLAAVVYLLGKLVFTDLLEPRFYTDALEQHDIYDRVYTELLADPALADTTTTLLGNVNIDAGTSQEIYSFVVSTLRLVLPPDDLRRAVDGVVTEITAYLTGERDELEAQLDFERALQDETYREELIAKLRAYIAQIVSGAQALVVAQGVDPDAPIDFGAVEAYTAQLADGQIVAIPPELATIALGRPLTQAEQDALVDAIIRPVVDTISGEKRIQIEGALAAGDLPGALAIAAGELLADTLERASQELQRQLDDDGTVEGVAALAKLAQETEAQVIADLNALRDFVINMREEFLPLLALVMGLSLAGIVWIHGTSIKRALRVGGGVLVVGGLLVVLLWVIVVVLAFTPFAELTDPNTAVPESLRIMAIDLLGTYGAQLFNAVGGRALAAATVGLICIFVTYLPDYLTFAHRFMQWTFMHEHRRMVLAGAALAVVLLPMALDIVLGGRRSAEASQPGCNGFAELCDRPINEVVFAATHNAMSISTADWVWPSHDIGITEQLETGVRALLIDTHYWDDVANASFYLESLPPDVQPFVDEVLANFSGALVREGTYLCHGVCTLGGTAFIDALGEINAFLQDNPREVVVLIIQDAITAEDTAAAFDSSGLIDLVYTYEPGSPWPTLGEMIDLNQRVLVMAEESGPPPDWYLHLWDYTEETPYSFRTVASLSCAPNRGGTDKPFFLLNHWIERVSPDRVDASILNQYDLLLGRARQCAEDRGQLPNFVAINFSTLGDLFAVVNTLNGVGDAVGN